MTNLSIAVGNLINDDSVDPHKIYCQVTGQIIGTLSDDCFAEMLETIPSDLDVDDLQSELFVRTLASARPSPAWNKYRPQTFSRQLDRDSNVALNYLLSRASDPIGKHDPIAATHRRIKQLATLRAAKLTTKQTDSLLLTLLELDSRFNLSTKVLPAVIQKAIDASEWEALQTHLEGWLETLVKKEEIEFKNGFETARSFKNGNSRVKQAYMQQFIRQAPMSPTRVILVQKEAIQRAAHEWLDELERSLTKVPDNGKPSAAMSQPRVAAKPFTPKTTATKLPAGFKFGGIRS